MTSADRSREAGNGTIEYVGMTALAVTLVLALLLVAGAVGLDVAHAFRTAICNAFDVGCGPSDGELAYDRTPKQCTVATNLMAGDGSVDIAVVTVGGGASLLRTRLSDGTYSVTLVNSAKAQLSTGVGGGGFVHTGKGSVGFGAEASAGGGITLGDGMVWTGLTREEADSIIEDLKPAVSAAPAGPFKDLLRDVWEFVDGPDELRAPDQEFVQGGLQGDAGAQAAFGTAGGTASATADAVIGYREDHVRDQHTVYLKGGISADASGGLLFGPGASAGLGGNGIVAVTVDKDGKPVSLEFLGTLTGELAGQLGSLDGQASDDPFTEIAREYGGGDQGAGGARSTQLKITLDLTNERNADAALAFLGQAGVTAIGNKPILNPGLAGAGYDLFERIRDTGTISVVDYDVDNSKYGGSASGKAGLQLGAASTMSWEAATATRARYWDGNGFVDLPGCVA